MSLTAYEYITLTGTIVPDTVITIAQVENEYKTLFGTNLIITPNTPQGKLITAEIIGRNSVAINNATLANQINPNLAGGVYLDAIMALTGSVRGGNNYSQINDVVLTGVAGTVIPSGSIALVTGTNAQFALQSTVTLDITGNGLGIFIALLAGPIVANPNTLTLISSDAPLGWETVNNPNAATLGSYQQSDEITRTFRRKTLASWGSATLFSITTALYNTPGVRSLQRLENRSFDTVVISGITLIPKSVWFCVDGGTDLAVATAIQSKASGGCGFNGSVEVDIIDPISNVADIILFDRPTAVPVLVRATIRSPDSVSDPIGTVIAAIEAYANGLLNNMAGLVVGENVSPFELAGAVTSQAPTIYVQKMEVAYVGMSPVYQTTELPIDINQIATIAPSAISVIILT
jgi:hypothetical protein